MSNDKMGSNSAEKLESLVISDPTKAEETEFLLLKGRPAQEYFGKLDVVIHGTDVRRRAPCHVHAFTPSDKLTNQASRILFTASRVRGRIRR